MNKKPEIIKKVVKDDGTFPNSDLPVLIYKAALILPEEHSAKIIEEIFKKNNWTNSWRNGIYDYHHYHSVSHEVLGVYEGYTIVELGGAKGITQLIEKGDIIIIPAGVAHRNVGPELILNVLAPILMEKIMILKKAILVTALMLIKT